MKLLVKTKSGKKVAEIEASSEAKAEQIKLELSKRLKLNLNRIRLTFNQKVLDGNLEDFGIKDGDTLIFKDLGFQIGWKTVFVIEYLGPLVIHLLFFLRPDIAYGYTKPFDHSLVQIVAFLMASMHYLKREVETLMVHRFSNGTMPWTNLFKNSFHYWVLGGILIAYPIYHPQGYAGFGIRATEHFHFTIAIIVWFIFQMSNLVCHIMLRHLRPEGTKVRKIPRGFLFDYCSCPNYLFEILGWITFSLTTGSFAAWFFTIAGAIQMAIWAKKKHKQYRREFKDYPKNRTSLVPFLF